VVPHLEIESRYHMRIRLEKEAKDEA